MSSGTLCRVAVIRTDVSGNVSRPYAGFFRVIGFHSCVTVESLLIRLSIEGYCVRSKITDLWDALRAASIADAFWDFTPCGSSHSI
jgi:hypothetical protein